MKHNNSLMSYIEEKEIGNIGKRQQIILDYLKKYRMATAREIMLGLDFEELNQVRPRLTELKQMNIVFEVDKIKCLFTGKKVSLFSLK